MPYNIRSERVRLGWTQADLARRLSVDASTVNRWEKGGAVTQDCLIKMRNLFGCTIDWLLGLTDERKPIAKLPT